MRKIGTILAVLLTLMVSTPVGAIEENNNFYYDDFTADYYLTRDENGISHLKVMERLTAVFPDYDQNKGICRLIPFTNQAGRNITLPHLTRDDIKLTRNGLEEPIYSIEKERMPNSKEGFYTVCTGNDEYVHGEQLYGIEYEFENVVTELTHDGERYQELYWDANGNGWKQRFNQVSARLHFEDDDMYAGQTWCYVGKYGEKNGERCKTTETSNGIEFTAKNVSVGETLTFVALLRDGSFVLTKTEESYTYVIIMVIAGGFALLLIGLSIAKFVKTREKANFYKGIFIKPEYQPNKDYSLPEMAEIYLGKKKDMKVAMLLELVVKHKIEFKKIDHNKWSVIVKDLSDVDKEYLDLLAILNGGTKPQEDDEIELKRRTSTSKLISLRMTMEDKIVDDLKKDGLAESKYNIGDSRRTGVIGVIVSIAFVTFCMLGVGFVLMDTVEQTFILDYGKIFVGKEEFRPVMMGIIAATTVICMAFRSVSIRYIKHTNEGLKASRYMDGLKLYIEMAEADRMKMLQSVKGADISPEGIVKLYEKLLPYAAVFGLEESWMDEMKDYCKVEEIEEPDYLLNGIVVSEMTRGIRNAASYAATATSMSSSGGGSSSGSSGSFGGGFSGGGGGGGGGFGR